VKNPGATAKGSLRARCGPDFYFDARVRRVEALKVLKGQPFY
jgi:hypothetical protein